MAADVRQLTRGDRDHHLFDERPIKLEGFTLHARGVDVVGRPTIQDWGAALDFAVGVETAGPFWIGALWNYGEGRKEWRDKIEQALADLGRPLIRKTLTDYGYIARSLSPRAKELAPSISHARVVVGLEPAEQVEFLDKAKSEAMTVRELVQVVRSSQRRKVIDGRAETCHTVEVTVWVDVEAQNAQHAQDQAWATIKAAIADVKGAKVVGALALDHGLAKAVDRMVEQV